MTRSRLIVLSALIVVTLGVMAALGVLVLGPARAAVGPVPAEGLVLPAQARFLAGVDVQRLMASPAYKRLGQQRGGGLDLLARLEETTGVRPERDVEQILLAGGGTDADEGVALVLGRFDPYKLGRALQEKAEDGVTWQQVRGTTVYLLGEEAAARGTGLYQGLGALAFLDERSIVLGSQSGVEATIAGRADRAASIQSNPALMGLLEQVEPGAAFWMVGDETLLAQLPKAIPIPGGGSGTSGFSLPSLTSVVVSANLDPLLALKITGEAADEAAAGSLADVVRGITGLVALRAGTNPELGELASAISVTTQANRVHVNARFPYELIESLLPGQLSTGDLVESDPAPQ